MIKAPRYMREYASHIQKSAVSYKKRLNHVNDEVWNEIIRQADKIISLYERGMIIEREAMRMLAELSY